MNSIWKNFCFVLLWGTSYVTPQSTNNDAEFDYIVVGAGPTGIMTAMGLAKGGFKTLLVDAGTDNINLNTTVPALNFHSLEDDEIAWQYHVKHYPESTGKRQRVLYPRASGIGGCTLHNAMIHLMSNSRDFREMVQLTGDEGWSEANFRKYFDQITYPDMTDNMPILKLLNHLGPITSSIKATEPIDNGKCQGGDKFLRLIELNLFNLLSMDMKLVDVVDQIVGKTLLGSLSNKGLNHISDDGLSMINLEGQTMVPYNSDPIANGGRRYGVREHLFNNIDYLPLTVWTNTLVTKVVLDESRAATGIEFLKGKYLYRASPRAQESNTGEAGSVRCRKEVIISAGTFNTPQILMLSGIGDAEHLREKGIRPRVHLPGVGKHLHDRYEISVNYQMDSNFKVIEPCLFSTDAERDPCLKQFLTTGTGPYAFNGVISGKLTKSTTDLEEPDLFTLTAPIHFEGYKEGMLQDILQKKDTMTMLVLKAHGNNRAGTVMLNTKDPRDMPDVNFNYFAEGADKDMPAIIKGIRNAREELQKLNTQVREILPGADVQTDEQIAQYVMNNSWGHHACGTSRMGTDEMSVINPKFQVHGTQGLRVVDLSIFPNLPGYFPALTLYLTGMKAADTILNN